MVFKGRDSIVENNKGYRPRKYTHIDYEALLIYIMKHNLTVEEAAEQFGIHRVTISRKVKELEEVAEKQDKNNLLKIISLYKEYTAFNQSHKNQMDKKTQFVIGLLKEKPVVVKGRLETIIEQLNQRENILEQSENNYTRAAKRLGITRQALSKSIGNKERIKKEFEKER